MKSATRSVGAAVLGAVIIGSAVLLLTPPQSRVANASPSPDRSAELAPSPLMLRTGWILLEHLGANAPDGAGPATGPGRSLWLIHADGTGLHELAPGLPAEGKMNPVWSRDGMRIAFETADPPGVVFETDVAGSDPGRVSRTCSGLPHGPGACLEGSPAFSPDGNELATVLHVEDRGRQQVVYRRQRYELNESCSGPGGCFHLGYGFETTRVAASTASIQGLSWSPDGATIAYALVASDAAGQPLASELWIVNADGSDAHAVPLPDGLSAGNADWSPDSSMLVFSSEPAHGRNDVGDPDAPDVYTVRPDGTDLNQLTHDKGSGSPSWTSDGRILFYSQREMWLMDADGSNRAAVFPNGSVLQGGATGGSYYGYWQPTP